MVLVAKPCAENEHIIASLAAACDLVCVIVPVDPPGPSRTAGWLRERVVGSPGRTLARAVRRTVFRRLDAGVQTTVRRRLLLDGAASRVDTQRLTVGDLNGDVGEALLRQLAPDVMLLSVAPMIKPRIYSVPPGGTVNLHWGIAPRYRGVDSIATALHRHDYANIGATLHFVDERSDTGPVVARAWPALDPDDSVGTLTAKLADLGARLLVEFLRRQAVQPFAGRAQSGPGELVRHGDRRVRHQVQFAFERAVLRRRPVSRPERWEFLDETS